LNPFGDAANLYPESTVLAGCLTLDSTGAITRMSAELERLFGYEPGGLKGRPLALLAAEEQRPHLERFFASPSDEPLQLRISLSKQNGEIPVQISLCRAGSQEPAMFVAFVEPLPLDREGCCALAARLLSEREEWGRGLAQRVHRELGQEVAAAKLNLSLLRGSPALADPNLQERLNRIERSLTTAAVAAQKLCESLYPPGLDELGLAPALRTLAEQVSRDAGVAVLVDSSGKAPKLSRERAVFLYRIVEEAIWNAARYPGTEAVTLSIRSESNRVRVEVYAKRQGATSPPTDVPGTGLSRMQALAHLAQATYEVYAYPGAGTTVTVSATTEGEGSESPHGPHSR
jgi:PAS domain S-box-containing protein